MSELSTQDYKLLNYIMNANQSHEGWQSLLNIFLEHFKLSKINIFMLDSEFNILFQEWSGIPLTPSEIAGYVNNTSIAACSHKNTRNNSHKARYTIDHTLHQDHLGHVLIKFQRDNIHTPFTQNEEKRFTHMSKFLKKAIELRIKFSDQDKNELRIKSILNKLRLPASYLDEFGDIIAHNNAMEKFIKFQNSLKIEDKKIVLSNKKHNHLLVHSISNSMKNSEEIESSLDSNAYSVAVRSNGENFTIGACKLAEKSADGETLSGALLYVVSPDFLQPIKPSQLKILFGLTEAEAQVCSLFAKNMTLKEIAIQENKSANTVREQLQSCYLKTNTKKQLELINLLSSLPLDN